MSEGQSCCPQNVPISGSQEEMPPELGYSVQAGIVTPCIPEELWCRLNCDTRRYVFNISHHMDEFFLYETIPPGERELNWSAGDKSFFAVQFQDWISHRVDPRRHWSLFSINFPRKTGNQCRNYYRRSKIFVEMEAKVTNMEEDPVALEELRRRCFHTICCHLFGEHNISLLNVAASQTACSEICRQQNKSTSCLTHYTSMKDKVGYNIFPGSGCVVGSTKCYASVILQFFARIDELIDLASLQLISEKRKFLKLLLDLRYQIERPGVPIEIDNILHELGMNLDEQQDSHELFVLLLMKMNEEFAAEYSTRFQELFLIELRRTTNGRTVDASFVNLDIDITDLECSVHLWELLSNELQGCTFVTSPRLLVIHVSRTKRDTTDVPRFCTSKVMWHVQCTDDLDLSGCGAPHYSLIGVIFHEGATTNSGHFFALFFEGPHTLLVDGSQCLLIDRDDPGVMNRISRAQESLFVYGTDVHVRCPFRVAVLLEPPDIPNLRAPYSPECAIDSPGYREMTARWVADPPSPSKVQNASPKTSDQHMRFYRTLWSSIMENRSDDVSRCLSLGDKLFLAACAGKGISSTRAAAVIGRSTSTVTRFLEAPLGLEPAKRKTMLDNAELMKIVLDESLAAQRMSCSRLAAKMYQTYGILISKETVRKLRRRVGMRFLAPIPKARLTDLAKDTRVAFASDMLTNRIHLLRRSPIIFTDESKFVLCANGRKLWRIPGECLASDYIELEQHPCQIMVWGAIGVGYKSPLLCFDENCNQVSYMKILQDNRIIDGLDEIFGQFQYIFQQDNAPPHVAKRTVAWLSDKVHLLTNWPPHSPDLSPVEMMWALMKSKINVDDVHSKGELFTRVQEIWNEIPQDMVDNMASSFEARLRACLYLRGELTQSTSIEDIDAAVQQLEVRRTNQINVPEEISEESSPLIEMARIECEFTQELEEEETPEDLLWDHGLPKESVQEVAHLASGRPTAWSRLVNIMQSTTMFLRRVYTNFSRSRDGQ